jgi:hypothetical protein
MQGHVHIITEQDQRGSNTEQSQAVDTILQRTVLKEQSYKERF